jgi:hypothetical protein
VFVPALWVPLPVDLIHPLRGLISRDVLDKFSTLRGRLVQLSVEDGTPVFLFVIYSSIFCTKYFVLLMKFQFI